MYNLQPNGDECAESSTLMSPQHTSQHMKWKCHVLGVYPKRLKFEKFKILLQEAEYSHKPQDAQYLPKM